MDRELIEAVAYDKALAADRKHRQNGSDEDLSPSEVNLSDVLRDALQRWAMDWAAGDTGATTLRANLMDARAREAQEKASAALDAAVQSRNRSA